jgi:hypothetical protein
MPTFSAVTRLPSCGYLTDFSVFIKKTWAEKKGDVTGERTGSVHRKGQ